MRSSDFISTEEVVAEAAEMLNDADFTHGVGKSFYELLAHRTIEKLALNTFFSTTTRDIFNWNQCGDGIIALPKNLFNIREIYLFNSSCDKDRSSSNCGTEPCGNSCCQSKTCWQSYIEAHWKRTFNKFGSTGIKTAKIGVGHLDPVYMKQGVQDGLIKNTIFPIGCLVYYGIQEGKICISDSGLGFNNMRITANGFGTDRCDLPIIPRELREAVVDTLKVKACQKIMVVYDDYKPLYKVYKEDLEGNNSMANPGSWIRAERFVKSLNTKQRNDLAEYLGNADIK